VYCVRLVFRVRGVCSLHIGVAVKIPPGGAYIAFFWSKVPLGAPLYKYGWKTLGYIAVGGEIPLEGGVFFACSRPIAPKGSLVCPQNDHSNQSPNPPSSVRASYVYIYIEEKMERGGWGDVDSRDIYAQHKIFIYIVKQ